jgi:hypothetical protein
VTGGSGGGDGGGRGSIRGGGDGHGDGWLNPGKLGYTTIAGTTLDLPAETKIADDELPR